MASAWFLPLACIWFGDAIGDYMGRQREAPLRAQRPAGWFAHHRLAVIADARFLLGLRGRFGSKGMKRVAQISISASPTSAMQETREVRAIPGKGLLEDRYFSGVGTFSKHPQKNRLRNHLHRTRKDRGVRARDGARVYVSARETEHCDGRGRPECTGGQGVSCRGGLHPGDSPL